MPAITVLLPEPPQFHRHRQNRPISLMESEKRMLSVPECIPTRREGPEGKGRGNEE